MDGDAVGAPGCAAPQEPAQLPFCPDRPEPSHRKVRERLEERFRPRADREPALRQKRADRARDEVGERPVPSLQIEHQLGLGSRLQQQLVEAQAPGPRCGESPAVPEERQRADALEVPNVDPASEEAEISFDERDAETFGVAQRVEMVASAVRDHERPSGAHGRDRVHCRPR